MKELEHSRESESWLDTAELLTDNRSAGNRSSCIYVIIANIYTKKTVQAPPDILKHNKLH